VPAAPCTPGVSQGIIGRRRERMREIKFRAWIRCGEWDEETDEQAYEMVYDLAYEEFEPLNDLLKGTENLMQYTGLKDKNGTEIYEGDTGKIRGYNAISDLQGVGEVKFEDGAFFLDVTDPPHPFNARYTLVSSKNHYDIEVIGNIYENPELLNS
jgi:uncharacterized phage protein (TIGR01671 family)